MKITFEDAKNIASLVILIVFTAVILYFSWPPFAADCYRIVSTAKGQLIVGLVVMGSIAVWNLFE